MLRSSEEQRRWVGKALRNRPVVIRDKLMRLGGEHDRSIPPAVPSERRSAAQGSTLKAASGGPPGDFGACQRQNDDRSK
jgi:hypothetical protein